MKRFLFTGDSITDADHLFSEHPLGNGYVKIIKEHLDDQVLLINKGYDGFTARRLLQIWDPLLSEEKADILTLLVGINDLGVALRGYEDYDRNLFTPEHYHEDLEHLVQKANAEQIVLMEPFVFPYPEKYRNWIKPLEAYQSAMQEVADHYQLIFIPLADLFLEAQRQYPVSELTLDGIHPSALGHQIIARSWLERVKWT